MDRKSNNGRNQRNDKSQRDERPQRRKRVNLDRNIEAEIVNNCGHRFIYNNPRMTNSIDMENHGDREYVTVGDLRVMMNSNRKILEGFKVIISDILDDEYELEDLILYLGLEKTYKEYYSLSPAWKHGEVSESDIKEFILKSNVGKFEKTLEEVNPKLREMIIKQSIALFKLKEFGDYQKMKSIRKYTDDDIFLDAEETEVDENTTLI